MTALIGIDCATDPRRVGLALAELRDDVVVVHQCCVASKSRRPSDIAAGWLDKHDAAIIALDAPLGWPAPLAQGLKGHSAGQPVGVAANDLFRRLTDDEIYRRLGKRSLDVGADRIARTAVAALELLEAIRARTGLPIPLAWHPVEQEPVRAIEVYPAATRRAHGAPDVGGSLAGLGGALDCSFVPDAVSSNDAVDAAVCALAAADFLLGRAIPPVNQHLASREGWIWAASGRLITGCSLDVSERKLG